MNLHLTVFQEIKLLFLLEEQQFQEIFLVAVQEAAHRLVAVVVQAAVPLLEAIAVQAAAPLLVAVVVQAVVLHMAVATILRLLLLILLMVKFIILKPHTMQQLWLIK